MNRDLPALPAIRKKREADITPIILQYFREHYEGSAALEIKATRGNSIPKSALQAHQRQALIDASHPTGIVHKIADNKRRNPFDAFKLFNCDAYVIAAFTSKRIALVIPVREWQGATPATPCAFTIPLS